DRGGGVENDLGGPIVLLELDGRGFRKIVFEIEDVSEFGSAPLVNRLVGIADHAQVAMDFRQTANQQVLRTVRVLVLVDHHELELVRVLAADGRRVLKQLDGAQEKVVEV